ncbi:hypothetical protein MNBD_NITROSPIRAE01-2354 [hydrothermal vent metagenome]|uniref:Uncharacterized protein n=1 Tax=hydrothermal vent metagenome TaxID=652676 RepID=A0A3B1CD91_9ZZZZ
MRKIALSILMVYMSLSGLMMVRAGGHALVHQQSPDHAAQHASFVCTWMCAASTSTESAGLQYEASLHPSTETPNIYIKFFLAPLPITLPFGRAPPV